MRTTETVTIKATPEAVKLARTALQIQDACNPLAVANQLEVTQRHFRDGTSQGQKYGGSDMGLQNPVSIAILNKLNDLAGLEQSRTDCFDACQKLAEGDDADWEINFLN